MDVPDLSRLGGNGPPIAGAVPVDASAAIRDACQKLGLLCSICGDLIEPAPPVEIEVERTTPIPTPEDPDAVAPLPPERELVFLGPEAYEYLILEPAISGDGRTGVGLTKLVVCTKDSCADAREELGKEANARRPFRAWELLPTMEAVLKPPVAEEKPEPGPLPEPYCRYGCSKTLHNPTCPVHGEGQQEEPE